MTHGFYDKFDIEDVAKGDILFFVRPKPGGNPEHVAGLHWLIHKLDGTPFTHVAVVTEVCRSDDNLDIQIVHSDGVELRKQALKELHEEYGPAPIFVSRPDTKRFQKVGAAAEALLAEAIERDQADYPHFDLILAALVLRARDANISEATESQFADLLARAITGSDDARGRRMCAAFAAEALVDADGTTTSLAIDENDAAALEQLYEDVDFWQRVGAGWVTDESSDEKLLIDEQCLEDVRVVFAMAVAKFRQRLAELTQQDSAHSILAFAAVLTLLPMGDEALGARVGQLAATKADDGWIILVKACAAVVEGAASFDAFPDADENATRLLTASRLVASSGLVPQGHVRDWGTTSS